MMIEPLALATGFFGGALLAAMFFGGLWWTVRKGVRSSRPALWFLGSMTVRTSLVMAGFYLAAARPREWLVPALVGFMVASLLTLWRSRSERSLGESHHAPHPG